MRPMCSLLAGQVGEWRVTQISATRIAPANDDGMEQSVQKSPVQEHFSLNLNEPSLRRHTQDYSPFTSTDFLPTLQRRKHS